MRAQPDQVIGYAFQFDQDDPHSLGTWRDIQVGQFFDCQAVRQVIAGVIEVIRAVGHHLCQFPALGFHVLLNPCMQEANIRDAVDDHLTIQLEQQAQHPMRAWVLRDPY